MLVVLLPILNPSLAEQKNPPGKNTLANLPRDRDFTILVAGDSLVAGYRAGQKADLDIDMDGEPSSAVGVLAREIAAHYPDFRVELILRSPGIDADGVSTCLVSPEHRRIVQSPPLAKQAIRIVRDGVGGNNVLRLLARWSPQEYARFPRGETPPERWNPDIVVVMLGVNDSLGTFSPLKCYSKSARSTNRDLKTRGTPKEVFEAQLLKIVERTKGLPGNPELFLATSPIGNFWGRESAREYTHVLRNIASRTRTRLIDIAQRMDTGTAGCSHDWYRDGDCIHPNNTGYETMGKILFDELLGNTAHPVKTRETSQ